MDKDRKEGRRRERGKRGGSRREGVKIEG